MTDRVRFAAVIASVVLAIIAFGAANAGQLASAGALLLALRLAMRVSANERPRLHVYATDLLDVQYAWAAGQIGVLTQVMVINLARTANAVVFVEVELTRRDGGRQTACDPGDWTRRGELAELTLPGVKWMVEDPRPQRLPFMIGALEAVHLTSYVVADATRLFSGEEWAAMAAKPSDAPGARAFWAVTCTADVYGNSYDEANDLPMPPRGAWHHIVWTVRRARRQIGEWIGGDEQRETFLYPRHSRSSGRPDPKEQGPDVPARGQ